MNCAPIALFVYNRPKHTQQTVEALKENILAKDSDLIVFSDAPKSEAHMEAVCEVREYIKTITGFKSVSIIERGQNWGLAKSIISGVTQLVNTYGRVIVLEDDLVTSPYFLKFMNDALDRYENEDRVMHVSGYMFPIHQIGLNEAFFLRTTSCWGWATWARAWQSFEKNPDYLIKNFSTAMIKKFNMDGTFDFWQQVLKNYTGEINTWAIFWYASVFQRQGLCLHPAVSMTINIGHDGTGINCSNSDIFTTALSSKPINKLPDLIAEDKNTLQVLKSFFLSITPVRPSFSSRISNRLRKINLKVNSWL